MKAHLVNQFLLIRELAKAIKIHAILEGKNTIGLSLIACPESNGIQERRMGFAVKDWDKVSDIKAVEALQNMLLSIYRNLAEKYELEMPTELANHKL